MSQEKAQLIAPLGNMTVPGVTATGVITATSFEGNITGSATSIKQGSSISAGVVTASSFAGNLTGNIQRLADSGPNISVGVVTATSFSGNLTGSVTDLTSAPAITVGVVTATTLKGPVTGNITGNVSGHAGGLGISYNGGWPGAGTSQISAGVMTATSFYGDGSNLDGVSSGPVSQQAVTIDGASTTIDLSNGNLIYATQSADTTVSFANSENGNVYFIRTKDDNTTSRTITWPSRVYWEGGAAPTLLNNASANEAQIFLLVTRDMGVTWYGKEVLKIDPANTMWAWGFNGDGQLGQNDAIYRSSPTQIGTETSWSKTGQEADQSSQSNVGGIKNDGTLWGWGDVYQGGLGLNEGSGVEYSSPVQVGTDTTWSNVAINRTSWGTKTDGTLWSWGYNIYGQLGQNNRVQCSSPTQLPGTDWSTVGVGYHVKAAIKTNGTLWVCGYNGGGTLGLNQSPATRGNISSPTQVGTDTTWSKFISFQDGSIGLKTDGTLWSWGYGTASGRGEYGTRSSPSQIPGTTVWTDVSAGYNAAGGITDGGELYTWGNNAQGQLGLNDKTNRPSPVQIPGTNWRSVAAAYNWMAATRTDGTLWVWGSGGSGAFGLNQSGTLNYSSPVQIPGTDWKADIAPRSSGGYFQAMRQG